MSDRLYTFARANTLPSRLWARLESAIMMLLSLDGVFPLQMTAGNVLTMGFLQKKQARCCHANVSSRDLSPWGRPNVLQGLVETFASHQVVAQASSLGRAKKSPRHYQLARAGEHSVCGGVTNFGASRRALWWIDSNTVCCCLAVLAESSLRAAGQGTG